MYRSSSWIGVVLGLRTTSSATGRKTDVNDAAWIADLLAHGLMSASFVPPKPIQELRGLTRTRKQLVREVSQHSLRIQKTLEDANIKLGSVLSDILGSSGLLHSGATDPKSIVEFALKEMKAEPYDRAFCVFDRDGHGTYDKASQMITASPEGRADRLLAITSWPCFELWLLLHFIYTSSPYAGSASRSAGDKLLADLQQHLANYQKGQKGLFEVLFSKLITAIKNAKRLEQHNQQTNATNPHTKVHQLVTYLIGLKSS